MHRAMIGRKFGKWVVLARSHSTDVHPIWMVKCDCGQQSFCCHKVLIDGLSKACARCSGSQSLLLEAKMVLTWRNMLRNIGTMDSRWKTYSTFLEDVGLPSAEDYRLLRINRNTPYQKGNVQWTLNERVNGRKSLRAV
jgi:hypothetical protein